ncbi:MAG: ScpA family protein [Pseudanabaenaceae cyanobacterium SKYGB_i_bin29]|nr:segregation/condensation protein A [Pseudanabaenaceae cyanobacterium SKYG29]MDW8422377.1 ScpA family protein [Pseudanabaenaceae cyanobacterium SKYGB_i_bin29]
MLPESVTKEAIALLIELAERGEIDPWDVDVIAVIDRFLSRLVDHDRQGLYDSGQAILYASMLLLLKAQTISPPSPQEADKLIEEQLTDELAEGEKLPIDWEKHIRRRGTAPPPLRKVTLQDLIGQIEQIAAEINKERRPRPKSNKKVSKAQIKAISQLAHKENLSEIAASLENFLQNNSGEFTITELASLFHDKVGIFWALLLLSSQSKVVLEQTEFYGEITVKAIIANQMQA